MRHARHAQAFLINSLPENATVVPPEYVTADDY